MTDANYLTGMKFGMGAFDDMNHFGGKKKTDSFFDWYCKRIYFNLFLNES